MLPANGSLTGAHQWCSHRANASESTPVMVCFYFRTLTISSTSSVGFLLVFYSNHSPKMHHEPGTWDRLTPPLPNAPPATIWRGIKTLKSRCKCIYMAHATHQPTVLLESELDNQQLNNARQVATVWAIPESHKMVVCVCVILSLGLLSAFSQTSNYVIW